MSHKHKKRKKHRLPRSPKEQLVRRITSSGFWDNVQIEKRPPGTEKMSEVLLQFAAPLLDMAPDDSSYELALELSIAVWNLARCAEMANMSTYDQRNVA